MGQVKERKRLSRADYNSLIEAGYQLEPYKDLCNKYRDDYEEMLKTAKEIKHSQKCDDLGLLIEAKKIPVKEISYKEVHPVAHEERAKKYAELMKKGNPFKPIKVFGKRFEGDTYEVFDGHARVLAHRILGIKNIDAEITLVDKKGRPKSCK